LIGMSYMLSNFIFQQLRIQANLPLWCHSHRKPKLFS
jgi:hypothetical protein